MDERQQVEYYLLNADRIKHKIEKLSEPVAYLASAMGNLDGMPHQVGGVSDPVYNKAMQLMQQEEIRAIDKAWLSVIDSYLATASQRTVILVQARRDCLNMQRQVGRPGWIAYASSKYVGWYCRNFDRDCYPPHRTTIKAWWKDIVTDVLIMAIRKNLL